MGNIPLLWTFSSRACLYSLWTLSPSFLSEFLCLQFSTIRIKFPRKLRSFFLGKKKKKERKLLQIFNIDVKKLLPAIIHWVALSGYQQHRTKSVPSSLVPFPCSWIALAWPPQCHSFCSGWTCLASVCQTLPRTTFWAFISCVLMYNITFDSIKIQLKYIKIQFI